MKIKILNDLYNELKQLTPMMSTGSQNVINSIYNIIDYLRKNNEISKEQYHKYIQNYLLPKYLIKYSLSIE